MTLAVCVTFISLGLYAYKTRSDAAAKDAELEALRLKVEKERRKHLKLQISLVFAGIFGLGTAYGIKKLLKSWSAKIEK